MIAVLPAVSTAQAVFVDISKGEAAEDTQQPETSAFQLFAQSPPITTELHADSPTQHPWSLEQSPGVPELLHRNLGENPAEDTVPCPLHTTDHRRRWQEQPGIRLMQTAVMRTLIPSTDLNVFGNDEQPATRWKIVWLLLLRLHVANIDSHAPFSIRWL